MNFVTDEDPGSFKGISGLLACPFPRASAKEKRKQVLASCEHTAHAFGMMEAGNCHVLYMRVALCVVVLFCDLLRVLLVVRSHYQTHRDCGQVETFLQSVSASLSPCLHLFATLPTFPCSCRMHIENEVKLDFKVFVSAVLGSVQPISCCPSWTDVRLA